MNRNKHIKLFEEYTKDYSGTYDSLYDFLKSTDSHHEFISLYGKEYNFNENNWDEYTGGEIDSDDVIIQNIVSPNYKVYFIDSKDYFQIIKNKSSKFKKNSYNITIASNDTIKNQVLQTINDSGVHTEYEPRFAVKLQNGKVIGGSTYKVEDKMYYFDIGIKTEYQGYGVGKDLTNKIINDAKHFHVKTIKAEVTNPLYYQYLLKLGFVGAHSGSNDSYWVTLKF